MNQVDNATSRQAMTALPPTASRASRSGKARDIKIRCAMRLRAALKLALTLGALALVSVCSEPRLAFAQSRVPMLSSLSPSSATAGSPGFTLSVTGSNFSRTTVVRWNGSDRPTSFVSGNQLGVAITASDIAEPGVATITAFNPGPSDGSSNGLPFTITLGPAAAPTLTGMIPDSAAAGGPAFILRLKGENFNNTSVVRWNGASRATTFGSASQLTAIILASDIASAGIATVTVLNGTSGSTSNALTFTVNSAPLRAPVVTRLTPNTATVGGPAFILTVSGANFDRRSTVRWNGADRPTSFVSTDQLMAEIPASDIAAPGTVSITVFNRAAGSSNGLPFTITPPAAGAPMLNGLSPSSTTAGGPAFTLTVVGANFNANSIVRWNGADRSTVFVSATQLTAAIPASDIQASGTASVSVHNPGSGTSSPLPFIINPPAATPPILNALIPNSAAAGGPRTRITVTGSGFIPASVVQWNGSDRETKFVSTRELIAIIPASDIKAPGVAMISVNNPPPGGGRSNALPFSVTPQTQPSLPPPVLASISSSVVPQGARRVRLMLTGQNFRPGARVVISDPQAAAPPAQAADIMIESASLINDAAMLVIVSVSDQAAAGARVVDVVNGDGSNTGREGSRTSQMLRVERGSSLAAPLAIRSLIVTHPRTGTVVAQGDQLFAEAIIGGTGTGIVTGQWLWDGNVTEQFAVALTGGERATLKTSRSLPTVYIGPHTLELRITSPSLIQSSPLEIVVNPGTWRLMRLLAPHPRAGFALEAAPLLRWAIVPGAAKYQVGFSSQPFLRTIEKWYDAGDNQWQVPEEVWKGLPEGELFWTVRVVEASGDTRQPALMRRIFRLSKDALDALVDPAARKPDGNMMFWFEEPKGQSAPAVQVKEAGTDAEADPTKAPGNGSPSVPVSSGEQPSETAAGNHLGFEISSNTQMVSGAEAEVNVMSFAGQASLKSGPWRVEMNGSGLVNLLFSPKLQHPVSKFNDYVFRVARDQDRWGSDLRFGLIAPQLYTGAEFVSMAFARRGVEASLRTLGGTLSLFGNAEDGQQGEGAGFSFGQKLRGASFEAPLDRKRASFRLMWLSVRDRYNRTEASSESQFEFGGPAPQAGRALGGLLTVNLKTGWVLTSEYGVVSNNPNTLLADSKYQTGRAWRAGVTGAIGGAAISLAFRDVTPSFVSPGNASLGQFSASDRRGLDIALSSPARIGTLSVNYQFLESDLRSADRPATSLNSLLLNWSRNITKTTVLTVGGNGAFTRSEGVSEGPSDGFQLPGANQNRLGLNLSVTQVLRRLNLSIGGSRNWLRDALNKAQNNITSALILSGAWNPSAFFQLQSNFSVNWVVGDRFSVGGTRMMTAYIQPSFTWQGATLSFLPLVTLSKSDSRMGPGVRTADSLTAQYGGRMAWRMPGTMRFSTLSVEYSRSVAVDRLQGVTVTTPRLLLLWTLVRPARTE